MGLFNDTPMYYDSLFNPTYYNDQLGGSFSYPVTADLYLIYMMYSTGVKPGMTMDEAVAALGN